MKIIFQYIDKKKTMLYFKKKKKNNIYKLQ